MACVSSLFSRQELTECGGEQVYSEVSEVLWPENDSTQELRTDSVGTILVEKVPPLLVIFYFWRPIHFGLQMVSDEKEW